MTVSIKKYGIPRVRGCSVVQWMCFPGVETSLLCKPQCLKLINLTSLGTGSA